MNPKLKLNNSIFTVLILLTLVAFSSCSTKGQAVNTSPSALAWKNGVRGKWVLSSIEKVNFPESYSVKTLFEEAPPECFIGSVWNLPSNGMGSITFNAQGTLCADGAVRNIYWSIFKPEKDGGDPAFQFKKIYPGDRAKHVLTGYRLDLSYADEEKMTMVMPIALGQQNGNLIFHFVKHQ